MFWLLQACVLFTTVEQTKCEATSDCIDSFGVGYTCLAEEGTCDVLTPIPRCMTAHPADFWEDPTLYTDAHIIGRMFDFESDQSKLAASDLAYEDILTTGSEGLWLDNRPLVMISCNYANQAGDTLVEKEAVETVTKFLIETVGAEVIIGPAGSQDTQYAMNLSDGRALFISPSATAQDLKPLGTQFSDENPGLFWRTTGSDALQSAVLQWHLQQLNILNFAILAQNGLYGSGIASALVNIHEENTEIRPTYETFEVNNPTAISGSINDLLADDTVQALVFVSSDITDTLEAIKVMQAHPETPLFLTDSASKEALLEDIIAYTGGNETLETSIVNQIRGTKPSIPTSTQFDQFASRFNTVTGLDATKSVFAAHTYDATWLAASALTWANANETSHDILGLARGLRNLSDTTSNEVRLSPEGWNQIETAFEVGSPINVQGVSGNLNYDLTTEELTTSVDFWRYSDDLSGVEVLFSCAELPCE